MAHMKLATLTNKQNMMRTINIGLNQQMNSNMQHIGTHVSRENPLASALNEGPMPLRPLDSSLRMNFFVVVVVVIMSLDFHNPCRLYIHFALTFYVGLSSVP